MCGSADCMPTSAADNVSLVSGGLRLAWLRALGAAGIKNFVTSSGLGYDFVCHVGDLAEYPFYARRAFEKELAICAAWLRQENKPVVYDVGANVGFISTHLAQMLASRSPRIYAFEPVPATFARLVESVRRLRLGDRVYPVAAAVTDVSRPVRMAVYGRSSLLAQVILEHPGAPPIEGATYVPGITLDAFGEASGTSPALVKMDVEGSEVAALRGARLLLSRDDRPAIIFEHNPTALVECGASAASFQELLAGYALYYVDDLRGQMLPFGAPIGAIGQIQWICNLFAVPSGEGPTARWVSALNHARQQLTIGPSRGSRAGIADDAPAKQFVGLPGRRGR